MRHPKAKGLVMADVTGPISTLAGRVHELPEGQTCDRHPDRKAVIRIQGETDSFGCEMNDMCEECATEHRAYLKSPEAAEHRKGICEWCKNPADDLRDRRDYEEGTCGRVYRVCGACVKRENAELEIESNYWGDSDDYFDEPLRKCPDCLGAGSLANLRGGPSEECPRCDGYGEV